MKKNINALTEIVPWFEKVLHKDLYDFEPSLAAHKFEVTVNFFLDFDKTFLTDCVQPWYASIFLPVRVSRQLSLDDSKKVSKK